MAKRILVVEDDANISMLLDYNLKKAGYEVETAMNGGIGLEKAKNGGYDLILLDIMLPVMDGFEVCKKVREFSQVPIIFVTARGKEDDKIFGLDTGADDYVTKPFSVKELISRVNANIRRTSSETVPAVNPANDKKISVGDLVIDTERYVVTKCGEEIDISKKDYDLLAFLATNLGKAYSREDLLNSVWGYESYYGDVRTVDVTICRLRNKIEEDSTKPKYLLTRRGVGYYLNSIIEK